MIVYPVSNVGTPAVGETTHALDGVAALELAGRARARRLGLAARGRRLGDGDGRGGCRRRRGRVPGGGGRKGGERGEGEERAGHHHLGWWLVVSAAWTAAAAGVDGRGSGGGLLWSLGRELTEGWAGFIRGAHARLFVVGPRVRVIFVLMLEGP